MRETCDCGQGCESMLECEFWKFVRRTHATAPARADAIRQAVRDQSRAEHEARNKRRIHLTGL
jgi:hypothetical protein